MRTLDVYTANPAKAVTTAYSVRVKAKWPPSPSTTETSNIFKVKVTLPAPPAAPDTQTAAPLDNTTTAATATAKNAQGNNSTEGSKITED